MSSGSSIIQDIQHSAAGDLSNRSANWAYWYETFLNIWPLLKIELNLDQGAKNYLAFLSVDCYQNGLTITEATQALVKLVQSQYLLVNGVPFPRAARLDVDETSFNGKQMELF